MNTKLLDQELEEAFRTETLISPPPNFTKQVLNQISLEQVSAFQIFSLLDVILSLAAALIFGLVVSLPLLLPEQLQPQLMWMLQWLLYLIKKSMLTWPLVVMLLVGLSLVVVLLIVFRKELVSTLSVSKSTAAQRFDGQAAS
jgi:hypothetical protein